MNFLTIPQSDQVAKAIMDSAGATTILKHAVEAVPASVKAKASPAEPERRREAYLAFQKAAIRAATQTAYLVELGRIARRPIVAAGVWGSVGRLMDAMRDQAAIHADLLGALAEVRVVGNPAPRAKAEEILAVLLRLNESIPMAVWKGKRESKQREFDQWQARFGLEQKNFAEVVRTDLRYAGKVRQHWWQWRLPKEPEAWPGGWPTEPVALEQPSGEAHTVRTP